jgi:hypothetical protein
MASYRPQGYKDHTQTTSASLLTSGTLPLARLTGITTTNLSATAGITSDQLAGSIANSKLATDPLARANHTGTQTASSISDFDTEVGNNSAVTANTAKTGISSGQASAIVANTAKLTYPSDDSTKLAGIEASATADQTGAEIKTAYEAETNAFTDTLFTKLDGIASSANNYSHTTNANLTGDVTSSGNATTIASGITITSPTIAYAINSQTGTTYTTVLADSGKIITCSNGSAITLTIPPNSSVAYPIGSSLTIISIGSGLTTFSQGSGVTIASIGGTSSAPKIRAQHSSATAVKIATDTWQVVGDIE